VRYQLKRSRIAECETGILVGLRFEAQPSTFLTEFSSLRQKNLIRITGASSVITDDDWDSGVLDEICVFVIDKNEFSVAVFKDIGDLRMGETGVDRTDHCSGCRDRLVRV